MRSKRTILRKRDFLWALAYPFYQIVGTIRHEGSHALVAKLEGATIIEFVFWPTVQERGVLWGYVRWTGSTSWLSTAAPYFADLLTCGLFVWLCTRIQFKRRWLWLNAVIIGLVSPLVNTAYNYWGGTREFNDVGRLLAVLPPIAVHASLLTTIALYVLALWVVLRRGPNGVGLKHKAI